MKDKDKLEKTRTLLVAGASWHLGRRVIALPGNQPGDRLVATTRNTPDQSTFYTPGERGYTDYAHLGQSAAEQIVESFLLLAQHFEN